MIPCSLGSPWPGWERHGRREAHGGYNRFATYQAFQSLPPTGFTFPNDRTLTEKNDELCRRTQISDGSAIADRWFHSPGGVYRMALSIPWALLLVREDLDFSTTV